MQKLTNFLLLGFGFGTQPTTTTSSGFSFGNESSNLCVHSHTFTADMTMKFENYYKCVTFFKNYNKNDEQH